MERSEKIVLKVLAVILVGALAIGITAYVMARIAVDGATSPRPAAPPLQ